MYLRFPRQFAALSRKSLFARASERLGIEQSPLSQSVHTVQVRTFYRLLIVDPRLAQRGHLKGERFTVAAACFLAGLGWMRFFSISVDRSPSIHGYMRRISERAPLMTALAPEEEIELVEEWKRRAAASSV